MVTAASVPGSGSPGSAALSPAQLRAALVPEDRVRFDRQWRAAMAAATETLDLTGVQAVLDAWQDVARLTLRRGPDAYRRILARAEVTLRTGEEPPGAVSLEEIRLRIADRLAWRGQLSGPL